MKKVSSCSMRVLFAFFAICLLLLIPANVSAKVKYNNSYRSGKRYVVTCNHYYDNKYNTLSKCVSVKEAVAKIKKVKKAYRGQWYVWDSREKKIVWPDLSTREKKIKKIVAWALAAGNDPRHGYDTQGEHTYTGCNLKWKRWGKCGDFGCSTFVAMPYELFGYFNMRTFCWKHKYTILAGPLGRVRNFSAQNIVKCLKHSGKFKNVSKQFARRGVSMLKPGDIVTNSDQSHTAIIVSGHRIVEGNLNENWQEFQKSKPGDQKHNLEINVSHYNRPSYHFFKGIKYVYRPKT